MEKIGNVLSSLSFQKNLTDMVRGLRNSKNSEQAYISSAIQDIKNELKSDEKDEKTVAVQKLTYVRKMQRGCS